ncbi:sensor histidine kinase [Amorphus coralli]|uniref:sensor histidine kinase n=1 Tax=Amorphus coralli TaxID=340680 RepID=UPI000361CABA|nr:ATP-binding protein [Amorphus coralli]
MRVSLSARITVTVLITLLVVWLLALAAYYIRDRDAQSEALIPPETLAAILELAEMASPRERALIVRAIDTPGLQIRILPAEEAPFASETPRVAALAERYRSVLEGHRYSLQVLPHGGVQDTFPYVFGKAVNAVEFRIALDGGEILVVDMRTPLLVSRLGLPVGFGAGLIGTVIALIALVIMHRETRPLRRLAAAADRIDLSGDPVELPSVGSTAPEIRSLIEAFDRLQTRLAGLLKARMAMLGGISHDVRTFATRLRLRVEELPDGPGRERAIADIADMIRLLDDALISSKAGAGELSEELLEPALLVEEEVEDRKAAGAAIDGRIAEDARLVSVLGDRLALRRIIANLVDNALRYGHAAHLSVDADADVVMLVVDDEGEGVPQDQRAALLEPFVRMEASRSRLTGGAGLGLAVVRSLVEAHGGTLTIGDAPTGGARFIVSLPRFHVA